MRKNTLQLRSHRNLRGGDLCEKERKVLEIVSHMEKEEEKRLIEEKEKTLCEEWMEEEETAKRRMEKFQREEMKLLLAEEDLQKKESVVCCVQETEKCAEQEDDRCSLSSSSSSDEDCMGPMRCGKSDILFRSQEQAIWLNLPLTFCAPKEILLSASLCCTPSNESSCKTSAVAPPLKVLILSDFGIFSWIKKEDVVEIFLKKWGGKKEMQRWEWEEEEDVFCIQWFHKKTPCPLPDFDFSAMDFVHGKDGAPLFLDRLKSLILKRCVFMSQFEYKKKWECGGVVVSNSIQKPCFLATDVVSNSIEKPCVSASAIQTTNSPSCEKKWVREATALKEEDLEFAIVRLTSKEHCPSPVAVFSRGGKMLVSLDILPCSNIQAVPGNILLGRDVPLSFYLPEGITHGYVNTRCLGKMCPLTTDELSRIYDLGCDSAESLRHHTYFRVQSRFECDLQILALDRRWSGEGFSKRYFVSPPVDKDIAVVDVQESARVAMIF